MHRILRQILSNVNSGSPATIHVQSIVETRANPNLTENILNIRSFSNVLSKMINNELEVASAKDSKAKKKRNSNSEDFNHRKMLKLDHASAKSSDVKIPRNSSSNNANQSKILKLPKSEEELKSFSKLAASQISLGKLIAVPTDTIYGLACLVQNESAVQDLYDIKGRHPDKPVSVCVAEIEDIYRWSEVTVKPDLLQEILPGPVTLCFSRKKELNREFNPESDLVGIRIPDHFFVRELCRQVQSFEGCCSPIALTSANVSGSDSCLEIKEFADILFNRPNSKLETIFDGGRLGETRLSRLGSTIVDLSSKGYYKIIRQGSAESNTVKILKRHGLLEYSSS